MILRTLLHSLREVGLPDDAYDELEQEPVIPEADPTPPVPDEGDDKAAA